MVTLVFRCPRCRTDCICGVTSEEEAFAFCAGVPLQLACWVCGTHSLVVHRSAWAMLKGTKPEHFFGECLKRAAECRCEAVLRQRKRRVGGFCGWKAAGSASAGALLSGTLLSPPGGRASAPPQSLPPANDKWTSSGKPTIASSKALTRRRNPIPGTRDRK